VGDLAEGAPGGVAPPERVRSASRLTSLLDALSDGLSQATSDISETLQHVARAAASVLDGSGVIWVLGPNGTDLAVAGIHEPDGTRRAVLEGAFGEHHAAAMRDLLGRALQGSGPVRIESPELSASLGPTAVELVPLNIRGKPLGLLGVVRSADGSSPRSLDLAVFRDLGDRAALVIDNANLLQAADMELGERRRAEQARRAGETTIGFVARSGPILLLVCDKEGNIRLMDGGLLTQFQRRPESFEGKNFFSVFREFPLVLELGNRAGAGEQIRRTQFPFGAYSLETWATPLRAEDGTLDGFAGIVVDASARVAAEAAVLEAARRQAALVEHASDVILVVTPDGAIHYVNPAAERMLGYSWRAGDVIDALALVHPDDRERCRDAIRDAYRRPGAQDPVEYRMRHANGTYRVIQSIGNNLIDDPAVAGFVITIRDVTEERLAGERYRANAERQAALADLGRWALVGLDYTDLVSDAVQVLAEQTSADVVHVFDALPDADFITLSASRGQAVADSELLSADPTSSPASFALVTQQTVISDNLAEEDRFDVPALWTRAGLVSLIEVPIPGPDMPVGILGIGRRSHAPFSPEDVNFVQAVANVLAAATARNRAESAIREQALQDPLTGLPNRLLLADHGGMAAAPTGSVPTMSGAERTVFVLDIDRFKEINDTLGHATGDLVLLEVSRRLRRVGDPVELVARLGGDEFALVARAGRIDDDRLAARVDEDRLASRILSVIGEALDVGGVNLRLRASIGIASADVDREGQPLQVPALLRRAEAAMYQAKTEHQGVRRYSDDLERSSLSRLALASELAEAIDSGQLQLDYQPKVRCAGGAVTGVEALVRWQHPTRGLLLPDVFVPLAEQTGIIRELTSWVLERALAECASWHRAGFTLPVAVNLSAGTVHDPALLDAVMSAISGAGLATSAIELEITESAVMRDPKGALRSLNTLTARGVRFALDDFGTGYSSLGYLQRLPVASLKIDKSFVTPLGKADDTVASAIVRAVVELGHSLNLEVIAEGVDSEAVLAAVTALGCDAVQGFFVAMPMEAKRLQRWLSDHHAGAFIDFRADGPSDPAAVIAAPADRPGSPEEAPSLP